MISSKHKISQPSTANRSFEQSQSLACTFVIILSSTVTISHSPISSLWATLNTMSRENRTLQTLTDPQLQLTKMCTIMYVYAYVQLSSIYMKQMKIYLLLVQHRGSFEMIKPGLQAVLQGEKGKALYFYTEKPAKKISLPRSGATKNSPFLQLHPPLYDEVRWLLIAVLNSTMMLLAVIVKQSRIALPAEAV